MRIRLVVIIGLISIICVSCISPIRKNESIHEANVQSLSGKRIVLYFIKNDQLGWLNIEIEKEVEKHFKIDSIESYIYTEGKISLEDDEVMAYAKSKNADYILYHMITKGILWKDALKSIDTKGVLRRISTNEIAWEISIHSALGSAPFYSGIQIRDSLKVSVAEQIIERLRSDGYLPEIEVTEDTTRIEEQDNFTDDLQ